MPRARESVTLLFGRIALGLCVLAMPLLAGCQPFRPLLSTGPAVDAPSEPLGADSGGSRVSSRNKPGESVLGTTGIPLNQGAPVVAGDPGLAGIVVDQNGKPAGNIAIRAHRIDGTVLLGDQSSLIGNHSAGLVGTGGAAFFKSRRGAQAFAGAERPQAQSLSSPGPAIGTTDSAGRFSLHLVATGSYNLEAVANDSMKAWRPAVAYAGGGVVDVGRLNLAPTGSITGSVKASIGGVSDYLGTLVFIPGSSFVAVAAADGSFEIVGVAAGTFQLYAINASLGEGALPAGVGTLPEPLRVDSGQTTKAPDLVLRHVSPSITKILRPETDQIIDNGAPGSEIEIAGRHFGFSRGARFQVEFQGAVATETKRLSNERLRATVPAGASSGPLRVVVGQNPSNVSDFKVLKKAFLPLGRVDLAVGTQLDLGRALEALDDAGGRLDKPFVGWTSSSGAVSVDETGLIQAKTIGQSQITLQAGNLAALRVAIQVSQTPPVPSPCSGASSGIVRLVAGAEQGGITDGATTDARFNSPSGLVFEPGGDLIVADNYNHRIRRISRSGTVSTLAGDGEPRYRDGIGPSASFNRPEGMVFDAAGNLIVADYSNNRIRKIDANGMVGTIAGNGNFGVDDGPGAEASFANPSGMAIDSVGNLYVADSYGNRIRKIEPSGTVSTVAGGGRVSAMGNGDFLDAKGTQARFAYPRGLAISGEGNLYVADWGNNRIRKIAPDGAVTTVAGSGDAGLADGLGASARFKSPSGVTTGPNGFLYVLDQFGSRVRGIRPDGMVFTLGHSHPFDFLGGVLTPSGILADGRGSVYVTAGGGNGVSVSCTGYP